MAGAPQGRVALVTGASRGIGAAVALVDRDAVRLDAVRATLAAGGRVAAFPTDVGDEDAVRATVAAAVAALGPLRGVVTSAGIFDPGDMQPLAGVELATFERT